MIQLPDSILAKYPQLIGRHIGWFDVFLAFTVRSLPFLSADQEDKIVLYLITSNFLFYLLISVVGVIVLVLITPHLKHLWLARKILKTKQVDLSDRVFLELKPLHTQEVSNLAVAEFFQALYSMQVSGVKKSFFKQDFPYYSVEIASTKNDGVRYVISIPQSDSTIIQKTLKAYFPNLSISLISDYLPNNLDNLSTSDNTYDEYSQTNVFPYPITTHNNLEELDPATYLGTIMNQLKTDETMVYQLVISPENSKTAQIKSKLLNLIVNEQDIFSALEKIPDKSLASSIWTWSVRIVLLVYFSYLYIAFLLLRVWLSKRNQQVVKTSGQKELIDSMKTKLNQPLFQVSIKVLIKTKSSESQNERLRGISAALSTFNNSYQRLTTIKGLSIYKLSFFKKLVAYGFKKRNHSSSLISILSPTELANLYHFPSIKTSKVEDLAKSYSKQLPPPLSLKNNDNLDVIFGKNDSTQVGLTDEDRSRHVYILGQTGSGKSTIIYHMAKDDIQKGRGVTIVDPHGDLAEDLLNTIPEDRVKDCIYFNPYDLKYPIGVNLLELPSDLAGSELEREKEAVCEGVISVFRRVFSNDEKANAHRIEYILRNAIYTAFTIEDATIFTVYELLTNPKFKKQIVRNLTDENLKNFWKNEFGKAGNYQVIKMVSGVTAKIGRFLFSPSAKRILEQPKSTINFDDILDTNKILICNLSEGKLGEDTSQLLGTTIVTKIQLAAMRRERKQSKQRNPYYLFVDEFQNFATSSFTKLLSGGRKFGLRLTIAEQTTAQQEDRNIVNVILANTGTVICFRTASPIDAKLMADQFKPYVDKSDINNLPRYKFYMRLAAVEPEEPFSGTTIPIELNRDENQTKKVVESSRKIYAIEWKKDPKTVIKSTKSIVQQLGNINKSELLP